MQESKTKEEMINNQLIAEFMGYEKVRVGLLGEVGIYIVNVPLNVWHKVDELNYHQDWNKLMEVWHKFRNLRFDKEREQYRFSTRRQSIAHEISYGYIETAYQEIVEAINWYNTTNNDKRP